MAALWYLSLRNKTQLMIMKRNVYLVILAIWASLSAVSAQQDIQTALEQSNTKYIKDWLNSGHDVNALLYLKEQKMSMIAYAASIGNAEMVQLLIGKGADVHAKIQFEDALMFAARNGNLEVIESLLKAGANPLNENKMGKCARDLAQDAKQTAAYNLLKLETEKRLGAIRAQKKK